MPTTTSETFGPKGTTFIAARNKALTTLKGWLLGVDADSTIKPVEHAKLQDWLNIHTELQTDKLCSNLFDELGQLPNPITHELKEDLIWTIDSLLDTTKGVYTTTVVLLQQLYGYLEGILSDSIITEAEVIALNQWLETNQETLSGIYPFAEFYHILQNVLADGIVTSDEAETLKRIFERYCVTKALVIKDLPPADMALLNLTYVYTMKPHIYFPGKKFCFTGKSLHGKREHLGALVIAKGALTTDSVSSNIDYLVVCDGGNKQWAYSTYGRKIESSLDLRKKGSNLQVIQEDDFWVAVKS